MKSNLIFDIGMFDGNDTKHYLDNGFHVISLDANPILVKHASERFKKEINEKRLIIINKGLTDEKEKNIDFWINDTNFEWSSFDKDIGCREGTQCHKIQIQTITTEELFEKYGVPYYLKVDIEGNDIHCINALDKSDLPKYFSCEANELSLLTLLRDKGYTKFKLINQGDNFKDVNIDNELSSLYVFISKIKRGVKNRTQHIIQYKYPHKTSGPFGEKTKGKWKTYDEVKELYSAFYQYEKYTPIHNSSHFDFHATF